MKAFGANSVGVIDYLLFVFLEMWAPRANIDIARSWPKKAVGVNVDGVSEKRLGGEKVGRRTSKRERDRERDRERVGSNDGTTSL